ncbi:GntR family transcriptional regulator [Tropicimonas sp. TH_r6]|uniref:GntR family transcriptional regulator n=1 Tax=Tropicimonas sp. TH_r6 TaxID=3082085 RepID=UPI002953D1D7|nr:GntR family transcriptional regulator [Tropicimonas sp. TH_r6]MDV7144288.1 GntR family transcriptional regulator [Tropicimonas sp. TH_r6]
MQNQVSGAGEPVAIRNLSLHDQVANQIRDMIIEGYLEPGTRIDEVELATKFGVSRTPFREALRTLAAEGLVVSQRSKGSVVRILTPEDVKGMLELLAHIELLAGHLVCERASDEEIADLLSLHEEMLEFWRARERMPYYKLNQEFHSRLSHYAKNAALEETQSNLQARLKRIRFMGNRGIESWDDAVAEHEEMADALRKRDGKALGRVMEKHLQNSWQRVRERL